MPAELHMQVWPREGQVLEGASDAAPVIRGICHRGATGRKLGGGVDGGTSNITVGHAGAI